MFSKKILFPMAAVAMASFVACGDDSSSSPASKEVPATVKTYFDTADIACSETENKCAKIFVEQDLQDTVQCNGSSWEMMILAKPVAGCENAAPAADEPAAGEDPAAGEEPGAGEDPAAGEEPGAGEGPAAGEEPGAGEGPAAGGDMISCDNIPANPALDLPTCLEVPAGTDEAEAMKDQCASVMGGTLGTGCAK